MKVKTVSLAAGTRVKVTNPGPVPHFSTWDDDRQRTSTPVKRKLQEMFFRGDKRVQAEVVYVSSETLRDQLKNKNQLKVQVRDPSGCTIVILADAGNVRVA